VSLQVVGAGVGRTGTSSLKGALEQLLGGRCYHMVEVFATPSHLDLWKVASEGGDPWDEMFADYVAAVDWPAAAYWPELAAKYPDALVLLSVRDDAEAWFRSASDTIMQAMDRDQSEHGQKWRATVVDPMLARFTSDWTDHDAAIAAYERHNAAVRAAIAPERLLEWRPGDGWGPLCERLGVDVPSDPFPHANTTEEFRAFMGLDAN
jgi:hypothetical protein